MSGVFKAIASVASILAIIPSPIQPIAQAVAVVASVGAALTAKKPSNERQGTQLSFKVDSGGVIPLIVGRTAVGGTVVYRDTYGTDNSYQTYVVLLSASTSTTGIAAIEAFTCDKVTEPFTGTRATGYYNNWMWQDRQLGTSAEAALGSGIPVPPPYGTAGAMPNWGAAYKLSGYAASSWSMLYDTKARRYGNGEPSPAWIVRGIKVYDPRLDSTYPGGSGPCRWADPSDTAAHSAARATWVYSERPALIGLMWRLGIWDRNESDPDATYQKVMGIGAKIGQIDLAAIVNAANVQDANSWRIGGQIDSGQDRWDVLKLIEETGGCEPIANGALMSTLIKAPRVSIGTITEDDWADGKAAAPGVRLRSDRLNGFRARFRSEPHGWEIVPIDIVQIPDYVAADGRAKTGSHDFSYCPDATQCAQLAAYEVFDSREIDPITVPLKPKWIMARLGDCVTLDFPSLGLEGVDAIVRGRQIDPSSGIVTMTFRTETAAKHAPALGQTGVVPPTPTLESPPDSVDAPASGAWSIASTLIDGVSMATPALEITGAIDNSQADAIVFEWRRSGTTDWAGAGIEPPDSTAKEVRGVDPDTAYEASVRYRARGILSDRLVIGPVTTSSRDVAGSFTLVNVANALLTPNSVRGSSTALWGNKACTAESYKAAQVAARVTVNAGIGLTTDPAVDGSYTSIDYWVFRSANGNIYRQRNGASQVGVADPHSGDPDTPYPIAVSSDGQTVRYFYDGTEITSWSHPVNVAAEIVYGVFTTNGTAPHVDQITVAPSGQAGRDAYAGYLTNEAQQLPADADGNVSSYSGASTQFVVLAGGVDVSAAFSFGVVGNPQAITGSFSGNTYTATAGFDAGENTAAVTLRATGSGAYSGVMIDKVFSLSKSKSGAPGAPGAAGSSPPLITIAATAQAIHYDAADVIVTGDVTFTTTRTNNGVTPTFSLVRATGDIDQAGTAAVLASAFPTAFSSTGPDNLTATAHWISDVFTLYGASLKCIATAGAATDTITLIKVKDGADGANGEPGPPGADGSPSWVHRAYASSADGTEDFSTTVTAGKSYLGLYVDDNPGADSSDPADYTWSLIKGADGVSARSFDLSTQSITITANYDGTSKSGQFNKLVTVKVVDGTTDVTASATVTLTESDAGAIDSSYSGGTVTISRVDSAGWIGVQVTYAGVDLGTKRIDLPRNTDPQPPTSQTSQASQIGLGVSASTYGAATGPLTLRASASGLITISGYADYQIQLPSGGGTMRLAAKGEYRAAGSSVWIDAGAEVVGTSSTVAPGGEPSNGRVSLNQSVTGLTANAFYEARIDFRKEVGSASATTFAEGQWSMLQ